MNTAQSSLIFNEQDGKMLSCKRWFISIMVFNFNAFITAMFILGLLGCFTEPVKTHAMEPAAAACAEISTEDMLINWLELKSVKYAKYKLSYPKDGVIHAKGVVSAGGKQVRVNILEINRKLNPALEIKPQTASFDRLNSKIKIKEIAQRSNAIAAINGGYFKPQTGVPLGALAINGELFTGPIYNRAAFSFNKDGTYSVGNTDIKISLGNGRYSLKIDNINQPRMLSSYTLLYTDKWGEKAPPPPKNGLATVVVNGTAKGTYTGAAVIPKGGYVVVGPKDTILKLAGKKKLTYKIEYPKEFAKMEHIVSGGPYLVKNGEIFIDTKEEKLAAIGGKNPRTMIGHTKDNELILVTVDGREKASVGMNLYEAAQFMKNLGCVNAINLDGGSSSVMYINGAITNTPPAQGGIPISSALIISENTEISSSGENNSQM